MAYRAFLDANVLMPARVRDVLPTLADVGAFEPLWSPDVLEEVDRHLPSTMDNPSRVHLFREMDRAYPEASTTWPEPLSVEVAGLVDEHDHHVVAASLWARADVLVTDDGPLTEGRQRSSTARPRASSSATPSTRSAPVLSTAGRP